jgi:hypothetical protein
LTLHCSAIVLTARVKSLSFSRVWYFIPWTAALAEAEKFTNSATAFNALSTQATVTKTIVVLETIPNLPKALFARQDAAAGKNCGTD